MKRIVMLAILGSAAAACSNPVSSSPSSSVLAALSYTTEDLGTLGGVSSTAQDINEHGQIVGQSQTAAGETHAFLITDGVMQDLGTLGGTFSTADDINDDGQVAGRSRTASGEMRAVLWTCGTALDLGPAPSTRLYLNEHGQVAWAGLGADGNIHPVLWSDGVVTDLGTLGGPSAGVSGINDGGEVVGSSTVPGSLWREAFVWRDGVMTDLGNLGEGSDAFSINGAGQIVGRTSDAIAQSHAVLWDAGGMTDLGTLPGHKSATAIVINDVGWVAGESFLDALSSDHHPFRWQAGILLSADPEDQESRINQRVKGMNHSGVIIGTETFLNRIDSAKVWDNGVESDLGTLGGESSVPLAINEHGTVVGRAQDATGAFRAVAWRPLESVAALP